MLTLSDEVSSALARAGWRPERDKAVSASIPIGHPARAVLQNLSGLRIGQSAPGMECASSDVIFEAVEDRPDEVLSLEELLNEVLVGIAEIHNRHAQLFIDTQGRCFGASLMHSVVWFEGETLDVALRRLLVGLKPRPILLPGQASVDCYGETYVAGDERLFEGA